MTTTEAYIVTRLHAVRFHTLRLPLYVGRVLTRHLFALARPIVRTIGRLTEATAKRDVEDARTAASEASDT
jgi:hypothetical protein